jgi:hypothetical protein
MEVPVNPVETEEFERAVVEATRRATQAVAKVHRRRLVAQGFLAGLLSTLAIALPVSIVLSHENATTAKHDTRLNCQLFSVIAGDIEHSAIESAAITQSGLTAQQQTEVLRGFQKLLPTVDLKRLSEQKRAKERAHLHYERKHLIPDLSAAARANCSEV